MLKDLQTLVLGDALSAASKRNDEWLIGNKTGDARLRADCRPAGGSATRPDQASAGRPTMPG